MRGMKMVCGQGLGTKPSSPAKFHLQFSTKRCHAKKSRVNGRKARKA